MHNNTSRTPQPHIGAIAQSFLYHIKHTLEPRTVESYSGSVRAFSAWAGELPADQLTDTLIAQWAWERLKTKKPNTVRGDLRRLSAWLTWATERGLVARNWAKMVKAPAEPKEAGRSLTDAEFRSLLVYTSGTENHYRDYAMLWVLHDTGMRIGEVCSMHFSWLDFEQMTIHIPAVKTKTDSERWVAFKDECRSALYDYIAFKRGQTPGPLWLNFRTGQPLTVWACKNTVREVAKRAGLAHSAHDFRRYFVERCQAAGMSDTMIMALTGHTSIAMIQRYGRRNANNNAIDIYRRLA